MAAKILLVESHVTFTSRVPDGAYGCSGEPCIGSLLEVAADWAALVQHASVQKQIWESVKSHMGAISSKLKTGETRAIQFAFTDDGHYVGYADSQQPNLWALDRRFIEVTARGPALDDLSISVTSRGQDGVFHFKNIYQFGSRTVFFTYRTRSGHAESAMFIPAGESRDFTAFSWAGSGPIITRVTN